MDLHVESLTYSVAAGEGTEYLNPPPLTHRNPLGTFTIDQGILTVSPLQHYSSRAAARAAIEPFLDAWEAETDLTANPGTIRFKFESCQIIDRAPPPPGTRVLTLKPLKWSQSWGSPPRS